MSCPSDIHASINENSSALVNWTFPVAIDNSNQAPQITVSPAGVTSPYTIYTSTGITYTATDASGNKDECSFQVFLEGQKIILNEEVYLRSRGLDWLKILWTERQSYPIKNATLPSTSPNFLKI